MYNSTSDECILIHMKKMSKARKIEASSNSNSSNSPTHSIHSEKRNKSNRQRSSSSRTDSASSSIESETRHVVNENPHKSPLEFLLKRGRTEDFQVIACNSFSPSFEFLDSVSVQEKSNKKIQYMEGIDAHGIRSNVEAYSIDMHCRNFDIFASCEGRYVFIWKLNSNGPQLVHTIKLCNHDQSMNLYCIRWGVWNDKDILAVCGEPNFVMIYEIDLISSDDGKVQYISNLLGELKGHGNSVYCLAFHPDIGNGLILTGSTDDSIRLWDLNLNFETIAIFGGHGAGICCLSFHESGNYFVSGGMDNTCRVYHVQDRVWKYRTFKTEFKQQVETSNKLHEAFMNEPSMRMMNETQQPQQQPQERSWLNETQQPQQQQEERNGSSSSSSSSSCRSSSIRIEPISVPILQSKCTFSSHKGFVDSCLFMGDVILSKTCTSEQSTNDPGDSVIAWVPDSVFFEQDESSFHITSEEDEVSIVHRFKGNSCTYWWLKMALSDRYLARPLQHGTVEIFDLTHVGRAFFTCPVMRLVHPSNDSEEQLIRECVFSRGGKYLLVLQQSGRITRWAVK